MRRYDWTLDPRKYLTDKEAQLLIQASRDAAKRAFRQGGRIPLRNYFLVCLALSTGLRVGEISQLICSDLSLEKEPFNIWVRHGKGNKERIVFIGQHFRRQCQGYLLWKKQIGESVEDNAPLFYSSNSKSHISVRALQNVFKKQASIAGLSPSFSIHSTRHTYACKLLRVSDNNLRLVQKQLGHASIKTTEVYADVMVPDIESAVDEMKW